METEVGFGDITPKPNLKTYVIIIEVYLLLPDFFCIS